MRSDKATSVLCRPPGVLQLMLAYFRARHQLKKKLSPNLTGLVPISIVADEQCLEQDLASWISDCDIIKLVCGGESETTGCVGDGILEFGLGGDPLLTGDPLQLLWLLLLPGEVRLLMASEKLPRCPQMALKYFTLKDPNKNLHRCWLSSARSL